ncbi:peptide chain release factor family protein [Patescibacteria group bacterium]
MTLNSVNPEDYIDFEEQFHAKGGGGGKKSSDGKKGKKTIKAIKDEQVNKFENDRKAQVKKSIIMVVSEFPKLKTEQEGQIFADKYTHWVNENLNKEELDLNSETDFDTSSSSGPGGQNVNKRSTKVSLRHTPTNIRSECDTNRNQLRNREEAERLLENRVKNHLDDWREYLRENILTSETLFNLIS